MYLANLWYTLFSILNRCLSCRTRGIDQCTSNFLYLFVACATNRHIDYALILWKELKEVVEDKGKPNKNRVFLPFPRFLSMIVRNIMRHHRPQIPRRSDRPIIPLHPMQRLKRRPADDPNLVVMPIPPPLLAIANRNSPIVREFLGLPLEESPEPETPTPEASPRVSGEGSERASSSGDEDEGGVREESKRGSHGESSSSDDDDDGAGP